MPLYEQAGDWGQWQQQSDGGHKNVTFVAPKAQKTNR